MSRMPMKACVSRVSSCARLSLMLRRPHAGPHAGRGRGVVMLMLMFVCGVVWGHVGSRRVTRSHAGSRGVTRGHEGSRGATRGHEGSRGVTRGHE
eukprot:141680-Prymnesium_polylepis.1